MSAREIAIFGEPRLATHHRSLAVGPLEATLAELGLRRLCAGATELLRGVAFVVRDERWGTAAIQDVRMSDVPAADGLHVRVAARARLPGGWLDCELDVRITARAVSLTGLATARGTVRTNRTGFTILYGERCAGQALSVRYRDGRRVNDRFPERISPHQPFLDVLALRHAPTPGVVVEVLMEGDTFEMEDQRNWSDASFKVYSRPLAAPFPYVIADGETVRQTVRIALDLAGAPTPPDPPVPVRIARGGAAGRSLPCLGIGGAPEDWILSPVETELLRVLRPDVLMAEATLGDVVPDLAPLRAAARGLGARSALLARLPAAGAIPALERLAASQPGLDILALADAEAASLSAARRLFPGTRIGAGTAAFFAEFNRVPPPAAADFVFWTVTPTVHATDDASVMETLRILPEQAASARALVPGAPLWCGPVTFRRRPNPGTARPDAGAPVFDARQQGLFGAAFTLGQIAAAAAASLETLILYQPFGPRGFASWPDHTRFPVHHLCRLLGKASALRCVYNTAPERVVALATEDALWLGNLSADLVSIEIPDCRAAQLWMMEADSLVDHGNTTGFVGPQPVRGGALRLGPFAVARVTFE